MIRPKKTRPLYRKKRPDKICNPEQTDSPDTNKEAAPKVEETDSPTDGAEIERGQYTLPCGMILNFSPSVRNDVTGQWKISTTSDSLVPADYAIEYYNALFSSDDEIHAIWNATLNTTTRITVSNGMLYVDTLEYVAGEEHDANILFSGNVLDSKIINIETGEEVSFDDDEEPSAETKPFTEAEPPTQSQTESIVDTKDQEQQLEHIHIWVDATCTEPKKCTRCGITDGKPLGHDMVPATTSAPSTCSRCGYTEGKPLEPEKETPPPPSQEVNTPDSNIPDGQKVYRTKTGKKYHYDNTCNGANYFETTWEEIKKLGLEPCEKCVLK